jgi:hypothetical protein
MKEAGRAIMPFDNQPGAIDAAWKRAVMKYEARFVTENYKELTNAFSDGMKSQDAMPEVVLSKTEPLSQFEIADFRAN